MIQGRHQANDHAFDHAAGRVVLGFDLCSIGEDDLLYSIGLVVLK